ncbi:MAG: hypothetical protein ACFFAO_08795 [Candidatus Hermodarchaeota archaeon]
MKEHKVIRLQNIRNPKKLVQEMEDTLNDMSSQGWDFIFMEGIHMIFSKEK